MSPVSFAPLQFGVPGGMELAVILLIAVLLFGANKIPKLARSTGQAMGEFQRGREEIEQELQEMKDTATLDSSPSTGAESSPSLDTSSDESESSSSSSETEDASDDDETDETK